MIGLFVERMKNGKPIATIRILKIPKIGDILSSGFQSRPGVIGDFQKKENRSIRLIDTPSRMR